MKSVAMEKPGLIQHKVRSAVKRWIEEQANAQDRSQAWLVNKIIEDAYERAQQQPQVQPSTSTPSGSQHIQATGVHADQSEVVAYLRKTGARAAAGMPRSAQTTPTGEEK